MGWVVSKNVNINSTIGKNEENNIGISETYLKTTKENVTGICGEIKDLLREAMKDPSDEFNILTIDQDDYEGSKIGSMVSFTNAEGSLHSFRSESRQEMTIRNNVELTSKCVIQRSCSIRVKVHQPTKNRESLRKPLPKIKQKSLDILKPNKSVCGEQDVKTVIRLPVIRKAVKENEVKVIRNKISPQQIPRRGPKSKKLPPISDASNSENKKECSQKFTKKNNEGKINRITRVKTIAVKSDVISFRGSENESPLTVGDLEKQIIPIDSDVEEKGRDVSVPTAYLTQKRPRSAGILTTNGALDEKDGLNNIILDFSTKLERLITNNHMGHNFCTNCNSACERDPSSAAGKITFFFVKKYGNVGKFILARLNEFLDSAFQKNVEMTPVDPLYSTFPLPCNVKDIGFSGDLKANVVFPKVAKVRNRQSRLPILIQKRDEPKTTGSENNNSQTDNKVKLRFPLRKGSKKKTEKKAHKRLTRVILPEIKLSSLCSDPPLNDVSLDDNDKTSSGICGDVADLSRLCDTNDGGSESNPNSLTSDNDNEVNTLANELIEDLWRKSFINDYSLKSMISE